MEILIVDDENKARALIAEIVAAILPSASIQQACDGQEALALASAIQFDLIFTDISMPGISGLEFTEEIRKLSKKTFIVFITAYKEFEYAQKALRLGAIDYLVKPITEKQVREVIRKCDTLEEKKIMLRSADGTHIIKLSSIIVIEKVSSYWLNIYTHCRRYKNVAGKLVHFTHELPPEDYIAINRKCVLRRDAITCFNPKTKQVSFISEGIERSFICSRAGGAMLLKMMGEKK